VFFLNRLTFSHPTLSRIVYQAVVTERKSKAAPARRLADVLWRTASGDDSYAHILLGMFHPATLPADPGGGWTGDGAELAGGASVRAGLDGVRATPHGRGEGECGSQATELVEALELRAFGATPGFERMYTIRISADPASILRELGRLARAGGASFGRA